jgi:hypothetical protein
VNPLSIWRGLGLAGRLTVALIVVAVIAYALWWALGCARRDAKQAQVDGAMATAHGNDGLAEPESFNTLKHGYARGGEAMQLVDNIRNYYDILARAEPRDSPVLPGAAASTARPETAPR